MMIHFDCDYMEGGHTEILKRLSAANMEQNPGYGMDAHCQRAREMIREACGCAEAEVYFLVGGTQTNATVIDGLLRRHQGVMAAESGHINVHEAGAIEASGHKVLALPAENGKVSADTVQRYLEAFYADDTWTHMVQPGMLYISQSTEYGTLYSLAELERLSDVCHRYGIPLYVDGARLCYALATDGNDVGLKDLARLADVFYIGGTKAGALFGEALVITRQGLIPGVFSLIKQHGALLAKGWLLGLQFETLFTDGLYLKIARHAIVMAQRLKALFVANGYPLYIDSPTNQQFFVLPNETIDRLLPLASFELWGPRGETETPVRFVTSWATTEQSVDQLERILTTNL